MIVRWRQYLDDAKQRKDPVWLHWHALADTDGQSPDRKGGGDFAEKASAVLAKVLPKLPIRWDAYALTIGKNNYSAAEHAPILIYPNPLNPSRYVVLNSSFTFREGSTVSNSQQTPKLPDWAIIDLKTPPSAKWPGAVVNAGFFGEQWQFEDNAALRASIRRE